MKTRDQRPHCYCTVYPFPHKAVSKKCGGRAFTGFYLYNIQQDCNQCNCYREESHSCDVMDGRESLQEAECYRERILHHPNEKLPIKMEDVI